MNRTALVAISGLTLSAALVSAACAPRASEPARSSAEPVAPGVTPARVRQTE